MTKSGKSTVSFAFLGKIYRFFDEIRRIKDRRFSPEFLSPKAASCLSEFTQIWREKPAKPLRLRVLFRQIVQTWRENQARSRRASGSLQACADCTPAHTATWRETRPTPSISAQETRYPHEVDTGLKSLATACPCASDLRGYRLKSPPKMSETGRSV